MLLYNSAICDLLRESIQIMKIPIHVKVVKWCRKKWNEHNLMYIYHKQCESITIWDIIEPFDREKLQHLRINYLDIISFLSIFSNTLSKLWVILWNEYIVTTTIISMQAINLRPQKCANTEYLKKLTSDIFVPIVYSRNKMQGKTIQ